MKLNDYNFSIIFINNKGIEEATIGEIIENVSALAHVDGHRNPDWFELLPTAGWLDTAGLILIDNLLHGIHSKVRLNVSPEDVLFALNKEK